MYCVMLKLQHLHLHSIFLSNMQLLVLALLLIILHSHHNLKILQDGPAVRRRGGVAEHLLVTPTRQRNIGIAFGTLNGIASTVLAVFVITALLRG